MATAAPARRNRAATETRLIAAARDVLVEEGFAALTPSAVARRAGVDKMLIYRYFGDMAGLIGMIARAEDFLPTFEQICGSRSADQVRAMPLPERAGWVIANNLRTLAERPAVLEVMVWELIERNELTAVLEEARESLGHRLMDELFGDVPDRARLQMFSALLSAGVTYLALRRRKIRWYAGVDLKSDGLPDAIEQAVAQMAKALV